MNKFQATLAVVALGSSVLVGCANTGLEAKIDAIAADVDALKALAWPQDASKTVADVFGKFTAFCTNLASAATTVSTITK